MASLNKLFYQVCSYMALLQLTWKPKLVSRRFLKPWTPPPNGWLKENLDGAFNPITRIGGVGVILRDSNAVVVGGSVFSGEQWYFC